MYVHVVLVSSSYVHSQLTVNYRLLYNEAWLSAGTLTALLA